MKSGSTSFACDQRQANHPVNNLGLNTQTKMSFQKNDISKSAIILLAMESLLEPDGKAYQCIMWLRGQYAEKQQLITLEGEQSNKPIHGCTSSVRMSGFV